MPAMLHITPTNPFGSFPLAPALVMDAGDAPHNSHKPVWVVSVQGEPVVEPEGLLERLLGAGRPLQDLLGPVHPEEAVELALLHQLGLRGVPQVVVRPAGLQLLPGVEVLPLVVLVVL